MMKTLRNKIEIMIAFFLVVIILSGCSKYNDNYNVTHAQFNEAVKICESKMLKLVNVKFIGMKSPNQPVYDVNVVCDGNIFINYHTDVKY